MSKIDELLDEYCAEGVPYLPIGDPRVSIDVKSGATPKSGVSDYWDNGSIPWMSSGEVNKGKVYETDKLITQLAYDSTSTKMIPSGSVVIALAGQGKTRGTVALTKIDLCTNQSLASIITSDTMDADFLFHFLRGQYLKLREVSSGDGTRGGLNLQMIRAYRAPVPPLEVQREIVRILDTFSKMEAELEAELEARKQQYEHYRDQLMIEGNTSDIVPLGEIATIGTGSHDTKDATQDGKFVFYARGREPLRLDTYDFDEEAIITAGDGVGVGKVFHFATGKFALHQRAYRIVPSKEVMARYLYHYLRADFSRYLERTSVHASVTSLRRPMFLKYPVALPSIDEQEKIVAVLDKFDALVNDLSIGLPAEIAARRRQYEFYRDQLLTFREAE